MHAPVIEPLEPPPAAASARAARRSPAPLLLVGATIALLLPFAGKPLHLDDPMYVWAAQRIVDHPFDPYGFEVNWQGFSQPMAQVMKNPPGVCYYLAAASLLLGWSDWALHVALMLPAVGVVLGVYRLAREVGSQPALAALATLLSPVFLISASTVMSDVAMLCGYVWAIVLWVRGLRERRELPLVLASLLIAVATLTKYFALTLFPLLVATALVEAPREWRRWLPPLALPVALLSVYQLWTRDLYGQGHLLEVAAYATATRDVIAPPVWLRVWTASAFVGGGALTSALVLLAGFTRQDFIGPARILLAALVLGWLFDPYPDHSLRGLGRGTIVFALELGLFVAATLTLLAFAGFEARRGRRDPGAVLLLLWLLGTLAFAGLLNWSVNGRATLAAAPAAALLVARHAERFRGWRRGALAVALSIGGGVAVLATLADTSHARAARKAAAAIHDRFGDRPGLIWFLGHWGFQHYMEQRGARPVDGSLPAMRPGDLLVQPRSNSVTFLLAGNTEEDLPVIERIAIERMPYLATMEFHVHAGFYSALLGPLPFGVGRVPPDLYLVMEVRGPLRPIPYESR